MLQAKLHWINGLQYVGESGSGHAIVLDADEEVGGRNTGMRPAELLLVGIGSCSGMDIASILQKKRQDVTDIEINVKGQKAETHPKKFTDIEVEFVVTGRNLSEEAVRKAVEASMEKYCSVKATLEGTAKISYSHRVINI
jgi:putative redox protein